MKKLISLLLLITMLVTMVVGCSKASDEKVDSNNSNVQTQSEDAGKEEEVYKENGLPKNVPVTITALVADQGRGTVAWDKAVEKFTAMFPNVTINATKAADIATLVSTKIAANDDADMYHLFPSGALKNQAELIAEDKFEQCDDMWDYTPFDTPDKTFRELVSDTVYQASFEGGWKDGKKHVCRLPTSVSDIGGLFFDKNLFEEKGWNQNPKTFDEFVELCKEIKSSGIHPIVSSGVYPDYFEFAFGLKAFELAHEAGAIDEYSRQYNNVEEPFYSNKYHLEMWDKVTQLADYFHPGTPAFNHTQMQMQVLTGKAAMVCTCSWVGNEMKDSTPEGFEWGYMPVPLKDKEETPYYLHVFSSVGWHIWKGKDQLEKEWCKQLIRTFWDLDIQYAAATVGTVPTLRSDYADDPARMEVLPQATKTMIETLAKNNYMLRALNVFDVNLTAPEFMQARKLYLDNIPLMCLGQVDYKEILKECDKLVEKAREQQK